MRLGLGPDTENYPPTSNMIAGPPAGGLSYAYGKACLKCSRLYTRSCNYRLATKKIGRLSLAGESSSREREMPKRAREG